MDPETVAANRAAILATLRLRADDDSAFDAIVDYLSDQASSRAARLALALASLCGEAMDQQPEDADSWLSALAFVAEIEDSAGEADPRAEH
ncbi:MAG: hypothetical protein J0I34_32915 [Pseudonocardia sp.]|uniref:hypothetical protein n=1 Tax=unclassified Pseudonocardia TaxID=2619320 RepID=UPI00086D4EE1|nr:MULTISPECIES: hypothetical protein [unclassified Pseudonocardia]MBN9113569.1 hypothetical protein [Pseudonocardia sp.]ODU29617.1 MAG: hypothetical protein ABS80_01545 [Pseudonocardia sp. SCN 72-51]ODV00458.1 MAG: hypothetical protein ABT15_29260 [Pseudonocardia sp. SCN 73-27]